MTMPTRPPATRLLLTSTAILAALIVPTTPTSGADLAVVDRVVTHDRVEGKKPSGLVEQFTYWQVDYRLRNDGPTGLVVTPSDVAAKVEGLVSNSRVASHTAPRPSLHALRGPTGLSAFAEVVESADENHRCRERATLQVWPDDEAAPDPAAAAAGAEGPTFSLAPGAIARARLRLEHHHFLYGSYDPLLGPRTLDLQLGKASLRDALPLDREPRVARKGLSWPRPPADRLDTTQFLSAPDSLHLEAHVAGNHQYRFEDQPIRYATRMRLRFSYLVAPGTQGECRARIVQYKDAPTAWKVLSDGCRDESLSTVGRWTRVERVFRTEADATSLALDFRIAGGAEVGELWIDDVSLEPLDADPCGP